MHRFIIPLLISCLLTLGVSYGRPDSLALQRLQTTVGQLQSSPLLRNGSVALSVRRARDGAILWENNAQLSLPSASTLKVVTTATALAVLGDTYAYRTVLEYDGSIKDSVLTGNIYIRGSGDPSLGSSRFAEYADASTLLRTWTDAIRTAGIRQIAGAIVGDATAVQALPVADTWVWGDIGNYYGAGLSGLNFNENLYRAVFQPSATVGQPARLLRTEPTLPFIRSLNRVRTGARGSGDEVIIYNAPFSPQVYLEGTVPTGVSEFGVKGSLPDPAFYAAFALQEQLSKTGVTVSNPPQALGPGRALEPAVAEVIRITPVGKRTQLHLHLSVALSELVRLTNHQSINLYAEALLIAAGNAMAREPVSTEQALRRLTQFWQAKGVDVSGFRPKDGSGLSPVGALTAANLAGILAAMSKEKTFLPFYDSIPVVGESGTVKSLGRGTAAAGNVRAKSGTIEGVRSYAGYATSADGELLTFAVLINKYQPGSLRAVTTYLERIMAQLTALNANE